MMTRTLVFALIVATPLSVPAVANPVDNSASYESSTQLEAIASANPRDGAALSELAAAYLRAGRTTDAHTAYRKVLVLENVTLTTRTGDDIWSHEVARRVLANEFRFTSR